MVYFSNLPKQQKHTQKYKNAMDKFKKAPETIRLVSRSLGSAVVNSINEEQPKRLATTTYVRHQLWHGEV